MAQSSGSDVDVAIAAAAHAFPGWSAMSGHVRARHLYALARLVQKRERLLAVLETLDSGKPIRESRDVDVPLVVRHLTHHAGCAALCDTEFPGQVAIGVCGQIIPWNFRFLTLASKIAPALAAGNTVVLKPADFTLHPPPHRRWPSGGSAARRACRSAWPTSGTGERDALARTPAEHDGGAALWYAGPQEGAAVVERASAGNLKPIWVADGRAGD